MRVEVTPRRVVAAVGQAVTLSVTVTNTGDVISGHVVRVLGVDPRWVTCSRERVSLFPGASDTVTVTLALPPKLPAGTSRIAVQVRELTPPAATSVTDVQVDVQPAREVDVRIEPATVTGGRAASFALLVENLGNTRITGALVAADEEERLRFRFVPAKVNLGPGDTAAVELRARGRRKLMGNPLVRPFLVTVDDGTVPAQPDRPAIGTFVQRPVLARGAISLVGLLAAVTVFALVITMALSGVVGRSAADRELALQVAQAREAGAAAGTGSMSGTVRQLTAGTGVPGVTVEVFDAEETGTPVASAATDDEGGFVLGGLGQGAYKLRFRGAGFAEIWYPQSLTDADATELEIEDGQARGGLDVRLGGLPATLSGSVVGADVTGATLTLQLPGSGDPLDAFVSPVITTPTSPPTGGSEGAIVRTVALAGDGRFTLDQVPSPGIYDLVVTKPGYATETQRIDVGGGETRRDLLVRMRKGDGLIAGRVTGTDGPLGGATITATQGETTVRTVSVTDGDVGAFTLRGLPTPGSFTVVVSAPGLASQTLSLTLGPAQQLTGVGVTLSGSSGSLTGRVRTLPGDEPAGGVTVIVTNGALTVQTVTQSTGTVGAWRVDGLPVPSAYTVTLSRSDLAAQTLSVSLDVFGNASTRSGVGAESTESLSTSLRAATAVLTGTATQRAIDSAATAPAGEVEITLSGGASTYRVTTASVPADRAGQYRIERLPPGTYTVSVNRRGTSPTSTIVTLVAGETETYDPVLAPPASIRGTLRDARGNPLAFAEVRLYRAKQYPAVIERVVTADARGGYLFRDVDAPEHYVVEIVQVSGGPPVQSRTITLEASTIQTVDITRPPSALTATP